MSYWFQLEWTCDSACN